MKSLHVLQNENEAYYEVGTFLLYVASSFMFYYCSQSTINSKYMVQKHPQLNLLDIITWSNFSTDEQPTKLFTYYLYQYLLSTLYFMSKYKLCIALVLHIIYCSL